ncbi:MAG TPA: hypothetical protein VMZ91_03880 [Candidatus Paceibacterota bacterium]|nr:hypothetical protein [Candidatus Paceibacterota bacterium]
MNHSLILDQWADELVDDRSKVEWKQVRDVVEEIYINESHESHKIIIEYISLFEKMEKLDKKIKISKIKIKWLEKQMDTLKKEERGEYGFGGDWWKQ